MKRSYNVIILALLAMGLSLVSAATAQDGISSVCLVTDTGSINDNGFNQLAREGAEAATANFELEYSFVETSSEGDYATKIQTCMDGGADLVITVGAPIQTATAAAAAANPDLYFIGVDQFVEDGPENFVGIQFREDQSGFLVGVLAALVADMNDEDIIAGVYGIDNPAVKRFRNGFEQGALYINPEWLIGQNILGTFADSDIDEAQGVSLAQQFIDEDAFIIFGAGGPLASAAIREGASQGIYVIGASRDEYYDSFGEGETEGAEFLISSALKNVEQSVYAAITLMVENIETWEEYGGSNYLFDAELGGVGFAGPHDSDIPQEIYDQVEEVLEGLISGDIETGVEPITGDLLTESEDSADEAGTGILEGYVMLDGEPLPEVNLALSTSEYVTVAETESDEDGYYHFEVPAGIYNLDVNGLTFEQLGCDTFSYDQAGSFIVQDEWMIMTMQTTSPNGDTSISFMGMIADGEIIEGETVEADIVFFCGGASVEVEVIDGSEIGVGEEVEGEIERGQRILYVLDLEAGQEVNIYLNGEDDLDTYLRIYDIDNVLLVQNDDFDDLNSGIEGFSLDDDGTVFVEVGTYQDGDSGGYTLVIEEAE